MHSENIKSLNFILESEYIAINTFDELIEHANNENIKNQLQTIQQAHRQHASQISTKIQNIGGNPPDSIGIEGVISETISNIKHIGTNDTASFLKEALQGEYTGIKTINELLITNADPNNSQLLNTIITQHQANIDSLNNIISNLNNVE
ncbi:DUF2383 domain-containing protein [Clostridium psychrophilum]|uniref:DUF2383 domain-containing protein n=1 Tax=Clostridium psychrophilum TaxID=132926 RepID=UPI001C0B373C|nr:DUF2383 domain-containing protein [Clostridium psychrophilum]MBU3181746.1 PA2169 family four-helix-bundle protein [Clostridium psychrophilum]